MNERDVSPDVVQRRLALLRRLLDHLDALGPVAEAELAADLGLRLQVERALSQLVEVAVHINSHLVSTRRGRPPEGYRDSFLAAAEVGVIEPELARRLAPSAGLRNVVVHDYLDTDLVLIAAAVPRAVVDYGEYATALARWLASEPRGR